MREPPICQVGEVRVCLARGALLKACYHQGRTTDGRGNAIDDLGVVGGHEGNWAAILFWTCKLL